MGDHAGVLYELGYCNFLDQKYDRAATMLKKAAACKIAFDGEASPGMGVLEWLAQPKMLRRVGATATGDSA